MKFSKFHFEVEKLRCAALMLHESLGQRIEFAPSTIVSPACLRRHQPNGLLLDRASPRLFFPPQRVTLVCFFVFCFFFRGSRGEIGIGEMSSVQFSHSARRSPERLALLILKDVSTEGIVAPSFRKDEERMNKSAFTLGLLPSLSISLPPTFPRLDLRLYEFVSDSPV